MEPFFLGKRIFYFLCKIPLILRVDRKRKNQTGDICKGTLDIECQRDYSVGLRATIGDKQKIKNYFLVSVIVSGKAEGIILLGFECIINPQNLIKIVLSHF